MTIGVDLHFSPGRPRRGQERGRGRDQRPSIALGARGRFSEFQGKTRRGIAIFALPDLVVHSAGLFLGDLLGRKESVVGLFIEKNHRLPAFSAGLPVVGDSSAERF